MRRGRKPKPATPPRVGDSPLVAILGRPNVGKSTLFNRLVGRQTAIVEDEPGVTRDRIYADTSVDEKEITLVDMGGFEANPEGAVEEGVKRQCIAGLEQADLILFVIDGQVPPTNGDHETVDMLRRSGQPSILVINKIDGDRQATGASDAYSLGIERSVMISALHGRGISDLEDEMYALLPAQEHGPRDTDDADEDLCRVAIIGRPNAGKSSLVNQLLGEDRLLTLDEPGTTRDPVDSYFERGGRRYVLVDTAGIRRKRSVTPGTPEKLAVTAAVRAIQRCHVTVMLIDSDAGVAEHDAKVLGVATERGRAVVVGLNKWDLAKKKDTDHQKHLVERSRDILSFAKWPSTVKISALTGEGLDKLFQRIDSAFDEFRKRVSTSDVNRLFENIIDHHPPPLSKGKAVRLYYATQASIRPPTFVVQSNYPEAIHFSYKRYVENRIREAFGFEGTPVRVFFRKRKRRGS
ncbi:MAG: ribosome biogenesis GTPase Der [Deltaproteobacteria bacterium]|nr:ribosome biogenesis GTPase Der [Deltaproteobacteria bacterium]